MPTELYDRQTVGPSGLFETADGQINVLCGKDKMFRAFALEVAQRPDWLDDPRYSSVPERMRHATSFLPQLIDLFKTKPNAYWSERCKRNGIPCGELRTPGEALMSPEAAERELVFGLPHPTAGLAPAIAQPARLSGTPACYGTPPMLGQHTKSVLQDLLGYSDERLAELDRAGAIALPISV
jgi:formyl-CoA transferase